MASNAPSVAVALVVRSRPSSNLLLLIINKKDAFALFTTSHLPSVGSVITIEWRKSMSIEASINVLKWRNYKGYEPMGRFTVKEMGSVTKFTGCFYTTGCVCYQGVQLENPAIFNDYIGIVRDDKRVLQRNFIGKLTATVTLCEDADGFYWILDHVDEYFMQIDKCDLKKYRGIVGAVGEGPYQSVHFITCRYFPLDVRLMTRRDEKIDDLKALLGREVIIEVDEDKLNSTRPWHVVGRPMQAKSNLHTIITGKFFLIRTSVEYRGCRDDHENLIVWSEELEVVVDIFKIFKSREYGVYQIEVTRYYEKSSFPRWRVFKVLEFIKPFESGSSTRKDSITKQVPSRVIHQRTGIYQKFPIWQKTSCDLYTVEIISDVTSVMLVPTGVRVSI
ncbi:hypothetical protein Q1695_001838 [Nippostrongylus brasiliensis]|nr:hypothetical protein Q1695_001838 [Nippostrongylus brasiliensis]